MSAARPLVFFSGKGGVGKTTVAAAAALRQAAAGERTLLVSTDPAHSTSDILGLALGAEPRAVTERLDAVEIDAEAAAAAHVEAIKEQVAGSVDAELLPAVHRHLDLARVSPGTVEAALFDRVVELIERCPDDYDRIVFDTAPTGHTLRLLALPALLGAWVAGLARLHDRRARFRHAGERLRDEAVFWLVLVPERLPIEETARAEAALRDGGLHVGGLVVNRLVPPDADGSYMAARRAQQEAYLSEAKARFAGRPMVPVEQLPRDVTSRDQLEVIGAQLAAAIG